MIPHHVNHEGRTMRTLLTILAVLSFTTTHAAERPNIVFIISDDHDYEHLGFMGNKTVHTPNLDRLAAEGALFLRAYATSSWTLPSHVALMTGQPDLVHAV